MFQVLTKTITATDPFSAFVNITTQHPHTIDFNTFFIVIKDKTKLLLFPKILSDAILYNDDVILVLSYQNISNETKYEKIFFRRFPFSCPSAKSVRVNKIAKKIFSKICLSE